MLDGLVVVVQPGAVRSSSSVLNSVVDEKLKGLTLPDRLSDLKVLNVADPFNFEVDLDRWIRFGIYGSGSEVTFESVDLIFPFKCFQG